MFGGSNLFSQGSGQDNSSNNNLSRGNTQQGQGFSSNNNPSGGNNQQGQGLSANNNQQRQSLFSNMNLFSGNQQSQGLSANNNPIAGNNQQGQGLLANNNQQMQSFFSNLNLLGGNQQRGLGFLSGNSSHGQGLFNKKPPGKELTEEEKAKYRSVVNEDAPKYYDILKKETKVSRMGNSVQMNFTMLADIKKSKNPVRKIYRVQRRKDITQHSSIGGYVGKVYAKSESFGYKYFTSFGVKHGQHEGFDMGANLATIFSRVYFSRVKTLTLTLESWYILELYPRLFSGAKYVFPNVENLTIRFSQMHARKHIPLEDFTLNFIPKLSKLKKLSLQFSCFGRMKDESLRVIGKTFRRRLVSLKDLEISCEALSDEITPEAISYLWESLNRIPNLEKLALLGGFSGNKINDQSIATLCNYLEKKGPQLLSFKLDVGYTEKLSHNGYQRLSQILANLLPNLQDLGLKFVSRDSIGDGTLICFGDMLSKGSNSLRTLSLEFGSHYNITPKGATEFSKRFKMGSFPNLHTYTMYFHMTYKLTFYGLYDICEALPIACPNLRKVKFSYSGSHAETDAEVTEKADNLLKEGLKHAEDIYLGW